MTEDLRFPIGEFSVEGEIDERRRAGWIDEIEVAPQELRAAVAGLSDERLDTAYRPEGWTARQVAHHLADSHVNSYVRFRIALTEDEPTIRPYDEKGWAELADGKSAELSYSLDLLEMLHRRWVFMMRSLSEAQWKRPFIHPDSGKLSLEVSLATYAWHGKHHIAHITSLRDRMGWN